MNTKSLYNTQLRAGLGLVNETKELLDLWSLGMKPRQLYQLALASGRFPNITASSLRNIIIKCFARRYLVNKGIPALHLKRLVPYISMAEYQQLLFLFTCRATPILSDFVKQVYWAKYAAGYAQISNEDARVFVAQAVDEGKTTEHWPEDTVRRVASNLTRCCADYGMLENGSKPSRRILAFHAYPKIIAYIAYELHLAGMGDNALLSYHDWQLFGLSRPDLLAEIKRLSLKGFFIVQAAGEIVKISWKYQNMEALCDVLAN